MKKLQDYIDAARSFNAGLKRDSSLKVVDKPKNENGRREGCTEYMFSDGVIIRHSWDGGTYGYGYKDYDHEIEVINSAGFEFDRKSLYYGMRKSRRL